MGISILFLSSCNVLKFVPKGKTLLDGNLVKVEGKEKIEDLKDQILLVPNRKMLLLVKFNLWAYYIGDKVFVKDSTRIKHFFTETIGEKPVYLDTNMVKRSEKNIKSYLFQKGYFDATVDSKVKTILKRSWVTYTVVPRGPYVIRKVAFNGSSQLLDMVANEHAKDCEIKPGDKADDDKMELERERIVNVFRNHGFYYFNRAFIKMQMDTGGHSRGVNLNVNISNPGGLRNERPQVVHRVIVVMDFAQRFGRKDTTKYKGIHYMFSGYNIKPNIINRSIKLRAGEYFSQSDLEATYNRLMGLGLFSMVNIRILPYKTDTINKLMAIITLKPIAKHVYIWEPQVITTDKYNLNSNDNNPRNYGFANSFILNNKNIFGNAEDFNIKFRVAAETQFNSGATTTIFGNFESNLTFELLYPKLLGLIRIDTSRKLQQNRTSINLTFLDEKNINYRRRSIPLNLTYQTLRITPDKQSFYFFWSPIQLSYNDASISEEFLDRLTNPADRLRLERTFRSYIIPSHKLAVVYNNKQKSQNDFWNIRYNIFEFSGNLVELYKRTVENDKSKEKTIKGLPYFQFFRTDIDAVHYSILGKNKTLVLRANIGVGRPYGNSYILPFEKQFFVGGSNSLRAWRPRLLGPGESPNDGTSQIDKTGDVMLVTNAEYRFAIAPGLLDGAFFLDAGNIWQITSNATPVTRFEIDRFYKQLAFNTGIGFRLDLSFFTIRLDWGIPLHDPSEPEDHWVIKTVTEKRWILDRTVLNVAVGYPF